jgi:hypothetical protein
MCLTRRAVAIDARMATARWVMRRQSLRSDGPAAKVIELVGQSPLPAHPFRVESVRKTQHFTSRIASDPLAKKNALERDYLLSAVGNCWERYLYSLRRV